MTGCLKSTIVIQVYESASLHFSVNIVLKHIQYAKLQNQYELNFR